jgi:drug/metabolite transporter (DMT)-like permease
MKVWQDPQLRGMVCIVLAMTVFSVQDVGIKWMSGDYPLHQVVLVRASVAACMLLVMLRIEVGWRGLRTAYPGLHLARGCLIAVANSAYFLALAAMPLAEAMAIFFVAPLIITALSALVLKEQVGPRRWSAVAVGMVGVVIMLRPGTEAFSPVALLPLIAATAYAIMQTITRRLGTTDPASSMALYVQVVFIVVCTTMFLSVGDGRYSTGDDASLDFLLRAWVIPATSDLVLMLMVGVINGFGAYLISQAYRSAEAAVVAPLEYVALPLAMLWGYLVFADTPDSSAALGIGLIVASGLYTFFRETRLRRARVREAAARAANNSASA